MNIPQDTQQQFEEPKHEIPERTVIEEGIYITLFHGRNHPEQDMQDWGFQGPRIGPLNFIQFTYGHMRFEFKKSVTEKHIRDVLKVKTMPEFELEYYEDMIVWSEMYFGDMSIEYLKPVSEEKKKYINGIIAEYFDITELSQSKGQIEQTGWYWADKDDNARYGDWHGPFPTKKNAIEAGKFHRENIVRQYTEG